MGEHEDHFEGIWKDFPLYQIIAWFIEAFINLHLLTAQLLQFLYIYSACFLLSLLLMPVLLKVVLLAFAEPRVLHQGIPKSSNIPLWLLSSPPHLKTLTRGFRCYFSPTTTRQILGNSSASVTSKVCGVNGQRSTWIHGAVFCGPAHTRRRELQMTSSPHFLYEFLIRCQK